MNEKQLLNSAYRVLAVDPGKSGAVCIMGQGKFAVRRDFKETRQIAEAIAEFATWSPTHAAIELVHAMPGQGVCSMFSFGRAAGVADGAFAVALPSLPVESVSPQKWQGFFRSQLGLDRSQEFDSRVIAGKICPWSLPYLVRKKDHNTADAVLIAAWKLLNPTSPVQT